MEEQDLDKISRLIHSITVKHKLDASFTVATYFGNSDLVYSVIVNGKNPSDKVHFSGTSKECIGKLEQIEAHGILPDKEDVLQCIKRLEKTLADQFEVLQRIEESKL